MNKSLTAFRSKFDNAAQTAKGYAGRTATAVTALVAGGAAHAQGLGTAIAGEVSGGEAEMTLVYAAVAVLLGLALVWSYIRRSAR